MKPGVKVLIGIVVLAAVGLIGFRAYRMIQERKVLAANDGKALGPLRVVVRKVEAGTIANTVRITGEVQASAEVEVIPKVVGRLEKLRLPTGKLIEEGTRVDKGQVIVVLEHEALKAAARQAEAALARAKVHAKPEVVEAQVQQAKAAAAATRAHLAEFDANLKNLDKDKNRTVELHREGSTTEKLRDAAVTAYQAALESRKALQAQLARAEAAVVLAEAQIKELADAAVIQAEAALKQAQTTLAEARIKAPISGVVCRKFVDEGDMVGPATTIVQIVQVDTVKVMGSVSERYLSFLVPGKTTADIAVDACPNEKLKGVIHMVGVAVDPGTRTVQVEMRLKNGGGLLKPGMFARIEILLEEKKLVPVVPDAALVRVGTDIHAYVVKDSRAQRRAVKLGLSAGARHEIIEGLKPGDVVVIKGQRLLRDGDEVETVEERTK